VLRCAAAAADGRTTTVQSKAGDALEVCRVVNGMWQVSGASWGRAEPAAAVDAMLRYADGGLATFDMADICKGIVARPPHLPFWIRLPVSAPRSRAFRIPGLAYAFLLPSSLEKTKFVERRSGPASEIGVW